MSLRFSNAQMRRMEAAHFAAHRSEIAERAKARFPSLFARHSEAEVENLAQACHEGAQALGGLQDYDRLLEFMAVNALAREINADPVARDYFTTIVGAETWSADSKVRRLFLDCATPHLPLTERDGSSRTRFAVQAGS